MRICEHHPKRSARRQFQKSREHHIRGDKTNDDGERITTNALRRYFDRYTSPPWRAR